MLTQDQARLRLEHIRQLYEDVHALDDVVARLISLLSEVLPDMAGHVAYSEDAGRRYRDQVDHDAATLAAIGERIGRD